MADRTCLGCGAEIVPQSIEKRNNPRRFCTRRCYSAFHYQANRAKKAATYAANADRISRESAERKRLAAATSSKILVLDCVECGRAFVAHGKRMMERVSCSKLCQGRRQYRRLNPELLRQNRRRNHQRYKARKLASWVEDVDCFVVFERDGWVCGICNEPVDPATPVRTARYPTLDHIIPLSKGGEHSYANVQLAHLACNARKYNRIDPVLYDARRQ